MAPARTRADRPLTPAAQRVLDVAGDLFYRRGINTVGMELVAEQAGVTKKTIYDRFGSKEALVVAYLRARDARWRQWVTDAVDAEDDPVRRILATFDALAEWTDRENERGCAMVNACAELADPDHPGRAAARDQKEWLRGRYLELAAELGAADPARLADTLLILHEGAVVGRSVAELPGAIATARDAAARLLAAEG
ncbi:TetR family transcriptional regulator [Murinocardiopsis flavida]|uniref:TetR family transcriptional regulator n=1 Tax=Murinocardiopsis flavida TaxID=645275 RepID=A0A2P8DIQ9_9ACTN|nr:TetR/AcrR family transcriptional regulator [Murinocardiopsis flavida]PSK97113.1 TetR family transcriptional regulator [Murinocardiopsis flavida]